MLYRLTLKNGGELIIDAGSFQLWCRTQKTSPSPSAEERRKQLQRFVGCGDVADWTMEDQ